MLAAPVILVIAVYTFSLGLGMTNPLLRFAIAWFGIIGVPIIAGVIYSAIFGYERKV